MCLLCSMVVAASTQKLLNASASSEGLALERYAAQPYRSAKRAELKVERCRWRRPMGSGAAGRAMDGPRLLLLLLLGVSAN